MNLPGQADTDTAEEAGPLEIVDRELPPPVQEPAKKPDPPAPKGPSMLQRLCNAFKVLQKAKRSFGYGLLACALSAVLDVMDMVGRPAQGATPTQAHQTQAYSTSRM